MKEKALLGLRTCIYKVGNLTEAKAWYIRAFSQEPYFDESFYVGFNIGGYELGLLPEGEVSVNKADSVLTYWGVDDIQFMYNHFLECGAREYEAPNNVGGELMVASVYDPWENVIGLIFNPYFKLPPD